MTVTARVSNGSPRHAMPSPAVSDFDYAALFYKDGELPENEKFEPGTKATDGDKLIFSFQRPDDTSGTFTLEIFAFKKGTDAADESTTNFSRENALLSGTKTGLKIAGDAIIVTDPIALSISSTKPGTVNLKITVPDGCSLEIDDTTNFAVTGTSPNFTLTQKDESGISAGAYQVTFTVKKDTEIVHIFSEYINVINGLCTDTWSGSEKGAAKEITQSAISSTVYVRGTGGWYDTTSPYNEGTTAMASDANSGSFLSPFATIQKAIDKIVAINDSASAYTILVDGTFTATSSDALANFNGVSSPLSVRIVGLDPSNKSVLNGNGKAKGVSAGGTGKRDLNLTLENLVITDGYYTGNGGGIFFDGVTLEMTGCEVIGCEASTGGGVYVNGGTFTMSGGEISNCTATSYGGGVYISSRGTFNMSGTAKIAGCETTSTSGSGGGGIYNEGTLAITGGSVSDCTSATRGGGVYIYTGTFAMSDSEISNCTAGSGGGVFITTSGKFNMSGTAKIAGCTATSTATSAGGGGVYVSDGEFTMGSSASVPAGDDGKNDVYLASGRTITVADDLTAATPVATIKFNAYTANRQVLTKGTNTGAPAITQDLCDKFAVTSDSNGGAWKIIPDSTGASGVLATTTFYVASTGNDTNSGIYSSPFATIQKGIDTVIAQNDGTSDWTIYIDGTLDGTTAALLGSLGMADFSALTQDLNLTIKALSGTATLDGGAQLNENGTLTNAGIGKRIINAVPASDVALNLTLENLVIKGGRTTGYGAGVFVGNASKTKCKCEMINCTISGNSTTLSGGGIAVYGTFTMTGGEISGNKASDKGGGIYVDGTGTATLTGCAIKSCKTTSTTNATGGGGIYSLGTLTVIGGTISDCIAGGSGGGIYAYGGKVECSGNVKFSGCQATGSSSYGSGGGICINSSVTVDVSNCTFTSCTAKASGGGIWNAGTLTVSNSSFTTCSAGSKGGGICNDGGTVTATDITYTDCTATTGGNDKYGF